MWVVGLLVIGGIYLAVNARMSQTGRGLLVLEGRRTELRRINSELTSELAALTAPERMVQLAASMGFRPALQNEVEYVLVEGYTPEDPFVAPRPAAWDSDPIVTLSPAYSETLGQWFARFLAGDRID